MFECDQLVYVQMQKTGCTHITSLLSQLFEGRHIGKHYPASEEQISSQKYFLSSIRNPWDWYVSLWTYGVQGNGGLRQRLTEDRKLFRSFLKTIRNPLKERSAFFDEWSRDVKSFRKLYDRDDNVESFRRWLAMIHNPANQRFLGEEYRETVIAEFCGFMTYRYLRLCCRNRSVLDDRRLVSSHRDIVTFDQENCYIDFFIRQESLEQDFCEAVENVRPHSKQEKESIFAAGKSNTSSRALTVLEYYDSQSIELVAKREKFLIDKFGYSPPE